MTPLVATSNVESVMLGVVGSLVASVVFLLVFRWSTRPKIKVTADDNGTKLVIANIARRAIFDVQVRAAAVYWDGAMGTDYKTTRPLTLSEQNVPVLLGVRQAKKLAKRPGRRVVDVSPASQATADAEPCDEGEVLWVTVSAVDSVSGVRRAVSTFPLGEAPWR